jgi:hypothetical protein
MMSHVDVPLNVPKKYENFIWFMTPKEAVIKLLIELEDEMQKKRIQVPFRPRYNNM